MQNTKFEAGIERFTPEEKITIRGITGRYWQQEGIMNDGEWIELQRQFIPDTLAATRTDIISCFEIGSAFVYFAKKQARHNKWISSDDYKERCEQRERLNKNSERFCELYGTIGVHEAIAKILQQQEMAA